RPPRAAVLVSSMTTPRTCVLSHPQRSAWNTPDCARAVIACSTWNVNEKRWFDIAFVPGADSVVPGARSTGRDGGIDIASKQMHLFHVEHDGCPRDRAAGAGPGRATAFSRVPNECRCPKAAPR